MRTGISIGLKACRSSRSCGARAGSQCHLQARVTSRDHPTERECSRYQRDNASDRQVKDQRLSLAGFMRESYDDLLRDKTRHSLILALGS